MRMRFMFVSLCTESGRAALEDAIDEEDQNEQESQHDHFGSGQFVAILFLGQSECVF